MIVVGHFSRIADDVVVLVVGMGFDEVILLLLLLLGKMEVVYRWGSCGMTRCIWFPLMESISQVLSH